MLYQMLSGTLPFRSSSQAMLLIQHIEAPVPRLESLQGTIPPALDELVYRMLAKAPGERPSASEVVAALAAVQEGGAKARAPAVPVQPSAARREASPVPKPQAAARGVTIGIVVFAILAVLALAIVLLRAS